MGLHPKLTEFRKAKHIKAFSKTLKHIESDLKKLGSMDFDAKIATCGSSKSLWQRFFAPGYGDLEEELIISTRVQGCSAEIAVPMGKAGFAPPYMIQVILPVPINGRAEYRRGILGSKWHLEPEDKSHIADLKRALPKVKMKQSQISRKLPVQVEYNIKRGYFLGPTEDGKTEWVIHAGYEGGILTGGNRPRVIKYLELIPAVEAILRKWNEGQ